VTARRGRKPVVLAFGGFDPTGGAGVLMDARAIAASGGYPVAVPSCLALQSTAAFDRVVPLTLDTLDRALACAAKAHPIACVKVGMVGTRAAAESLLAFLDARPSLPVVLDPVIRATSGGALLASNALAAYRRLIARAGVLTPNLPEIEKIVDRPLPRFEDAVIAARDLSQSTGASIVLKGGHFPWKGKRGIDVVFEDGAVTLLPPPRKLPPRDAHGTGCAFASALATRLARGEGTVRAATGAKRLVADWIACGFPSAEGRWTLDDGNAFPEG
jgi:hydroxymethylpyrimidine kinase/phosphomethylpyrimidine kinase